MSIDLTPFCSRDPLHPKLHAPFSLGEHTYATNGHIAIRIPRLARAAEIENAPDMERVLGPLAWDDCAPFEPLTLPRRHEGECVDCDGRGTEHDCPECTCQCQHCNGTGTTDGFHEASICINGLAFDVEYVRLIQSLPGLKVPPNPLFGQPMPFVFDGGRGALMPVCDTFTTHIGPKPTAKGQAS